VRLVAHRRDLIDVQCRVRKLLLLVVLVALASCKNIETGAREEFARKHSCPEDRVEVKARTDVKWGQLTMPPDRDAPPPDEVKNDPGRLAKWQADQAESGSGKMRRHLDSLDVFEFHGCGQDALMACKHPTSTDGTNMNAVICFDAPPSK
jgi:hypothetical protein